MKEIGLALGGGAARGFIHIGVLKYLEETDIQILEVSGTSMGAVIATCIALGFSAEKIADIARNIKYFSLVDFDLKLGFLKGDKLMQLMIDTFGDAQFEDTIMPLKITATNINSGKLKVFETGSIIDALRSSVSLPGILKPHVIGDEIYIDGGVVSNLPIDLLSEHDKIGVSAVKRTTTPLKTSKTNLFGFKVSKGFFTLNYQILYRSLNILMAQNETKSIEIATGNKLILAPEFGDLDMADFNKLEEFISIGYNLAKENIIVKG